MKYFVFLVLLLFSQSVFAFSLHEQDDFSLGLKGYYKNLFFGTKRAVTNDVMIADINRLRTEWDAKIFKNFSAKVIWDNEVIGGDYVNSEEFSLRQAQRAVPFLDMDYELARKKNFFYGQQFYRAYGQWDQGPVQLTVGRQQVGWGVMRLFTPADLFTRLPIFDIEKEERVGSTAANLMLTLGNGFRINPVYEIQSDIDRSRLGARVTKTVGHFDVSLLGGRFLTDEVVGFDFTGDIQKAGVRGEFIFDHSEAGRNFAQLSLGMDYGFENSFYFAIEYFLNTQGTNNALTFVPIATGSQIQSVHENFLALQFKYDITPLWKISSIGVMDTTGGSIFFVPEMTYETFSWMEVGAGAQLPFGKIGGEFTTVPNVFYGKTQLFF